MITAYIDGTSCPNPGKMGIAVVIVKDGRVVRRISGSPGRGTNNQAEYLAAIRALKEAKGSELLLLSDSQLLVRQLKGEYKVKDKELQKLKKEFDNLKKNRKIEIKWIPRERNKLADKLAGAAVGRLSDI